MAPERKHILEQPLVTRFVGLIRWSLRSLESHPGVRRWLGVATNATVFALFGLTVYQNRTDLPLVEQLLRPSILGACLLAYFVSSLVQFLVWFSLMGYQRDEQGIALEDYVRTTFMSRVPGGIWKIIGRMTVYRAPRLSSRTILAINVLELVLLLVANGLILVVLLPVPIVFKIAGIVLGMLALVLIARIVPRFVPTVRMQGSGPQMLAWLALYAIAWICGGLITMALFRPLSSATSITFPIALRLWCMSGSVALILQLLPLSTLFRDVTLVGLAHTFLPLHRAVIGVLAIRLVSLGSEIIIGWSVLGCMRMLQRRRKDGPTRSKVIGKPDSMKVK